MRPQSQASTPQGCALALVVLGVGVGVDGVVVVIVDGVGFAAVRGALSDRGRILRVALR